MRASNACSILLLAGLLFHSCSPRIIGPLTVGIDPVVSFQATSMDRKIMLTFMANNNIPDFQGFNIYASPSSNLLSVSSKDKVGPSNWLVSFPTTAENPDLLLSYAITNDSGRFSLTNGRRYYVWIRAAGLQNGALVLSDASRILPAVPLSNSLLILNNQNISAKAGDAVLIDGSGIPVLQDCPDLPAAGTVSLFFELRDNAGGYSPYCTVFSNGTYIQDLGYAGTITAKSAVPEWPNGYPGPASSVLLIQDHVLALYDQTGALYAKIFVESVPAIQASAAADVTCSLRFMVQTIPGMTEF